MVVTLLVGYTVVALVAAVVVFVASARLGDERSTRARSALV